MKTNNSWMVALFVIPLISFVMLGIAYFILYSMLSHTMLGASQAIGLIAVVCCFLIPGITSKIFKVKSFQVVAIWIVFVFLAFVLNKNGDGAQRDALVMHYLGFQMAATAVTTMFVSYHLMKQKK